MSLSTSQIHGVPTDAFLAINSVKYFFA